MNFKQKYLLNKRLRNIDSKKEESSKGKRKFKLYINENIIKTKYCIKTQELQNFFEKNNFNFPYYIKNDKEYVIKKISGFFHSSTISDICNLDIENSSVTRSLFYLIKYKNL